MFRFPKDATVTPEPIVVLDRHYADWGGAFAGSFAVTVCALDSLGDLGSDNPVRAIITAGVRPLPPEVLELPNLGLVALLGAGYDAIDRVAFQRRNIALTHAPGRNAGDVATHALAMFLAQNRRLAENHARVRRGEWRDPQRDREVRSLAGLKAGIVGLGAVGLEIARRAAAFGCEVQWWGPREKPAEPWIRSASLNDLAAWSDVLFICASGGRHSDGIVDAEVIRRIGPTGCLVNLARGTLVDEAALRLALASKALGAAALDVFREEPPSATDWRATPNVLLSPHRGAVGDHGRRAMAAMVAENVRRFLAGEPLLSPLTL